MTQVSITKCSNYNSQDVQQAVNEAVRLLGGVERFIKPGQKVLIKPNLLSARLPEDGVCTHPEVVRAVIRLAKKVTDKIFVGDSHGGFDIINMDDVYELSGMKKLCLEEKVTLVRFDNVLMIEDIPFAKIVKEVDVIINVPKMKTHGLLTLTGGVKNMFGAVVGKHKAEAHFKYVRPSDFASYIVKIFLHVKPALTIMDGIVAMEGNGPAAGELKNAGLILASPDAVALDAVYADIVGLEPARVLTTVYAGNMNLGTSKLSDIQVLGELIEKARIKDFKLPEASFIYNAPEWAIKIFGTVIKTFPFIDIDSCISCRICEKNCPASAITIDDYHIDYAKCIFCFCCHELCPHNSIGVKKPLAGKIFSYITGRKKRCRLKQLNGKTAQSE